MPSIYCSEFLSNSRFPSHETDEFNYVVSKVEKPMIGVVQLDEPIQILETTTNHIYNSGITRKTITVSTEENVIIVTGETWTTKNPYYFRWNNVADLFIANYVFLNDPIGKMWSGKSPEISLLGAAVVATLHGLPLVQYLWNGKTDVLQSIANTISIEKTTLSDIADRKNIIFTDALRSFVVKNKENLASIPVITIISKFSKDSQKSNFTIYIKNQNDALRSSEWIDDPVK